MLKTRKVSTRPRAPPARSGVGRSLTTEVASYFIYAVRVQYGAPPPVEEEVVDVHDPSPFSEAA